jgi:hypothetical protein
MDLAKRPRHRDDVVIPAQNSRLRTRPSWWMLSVSLILVGVAVAVGWLVGRGFEASVDPSTVAEAPAPIISAPVELRRLEDIALVPASLRVGDTHAVAYEGDIARPILTAMLVAAGEAIGDGTILYEVSGQPVVAFIGTAVEYRDLVRGAKGPDVFDLQRGLVRLGYLELDPDGSFGSATGLALRRFLADREFESDILPFGHYLFVPEGARIIDVTASLGARLGSEEAVLTYATGEMEAVAVFTAGQASLWTASSTVFLQGDSRSLALDEAIPQENGATSFVFSIPFPVSDPPGSQLQLKVQFDATDGAVMVVPLTALNVGPHGEVFVRRLEEGQPSDPIRVQPGIEVDGWVEIEVARDALSPGDQVVLGDISEQ